MRWHLYFLALEDRLFKCICLFGYFTLIHPIVNTFQLPFFQLSLLFTAAGDEILAWAVPSNAEIAKDEATHLLGVADADRDALLSIDEILNEHELFVGSAATDYGKRLEDEL